MLFIRNLRRSFEMILFICVAAFVLVRMDRTAQGASLSPSNMSDRSLISFYDDLRESPTAIFRPVREPEESPGRAMHVVVDPHRLGPEGRDAITMCHVPIFLRYTDTDPQTGNFVDVSHLSYGGTAAALLAMHHFNNGDGSVVESLSGINSRCNIRFTTEVVDTQSSSVVAVQNLANMITRRLATDIEYPQACAVMGAAWFDISQSMATVTGVYDLLQVSPSSSSMSLDSMSKYPLFSRTHPSDEAKGVLSVDYFQKVLKVKHFGILFVNTELGISLQNKVVDLASERNMTVKSVAFDEGANLESLQNSLKQLKDTEFNYFLGIFFPLNYDYVMEIAVGVGVAGPGKFWLFTGHLADAFAGGNTTVKTGSNAAIGSAGNGILHDYIEPGLSIYDKFSTQWKAIKEDRSVLDYINSKQPAPPEGSDIQLTRRGEYFDLLPSHYAQFSYDAIAGMGLAACEAARKSNKPDNYFTGKDHHNQFVKNSFIGATGNVTFTPGSFSRSGYSTYFFVSGIYEIDQPSNGVSVFSGKTGMYFDTKSRKWLKWPGGKDFVYSDGTTNPPDELPPLHEDQLVVVPFVRGVCILMAAIAMLTSLGLAGFVFVKQNNPVITASQPPFLYMLCSGTLIMSSAIIPLAVDDSITSPQGCTVACVSRIWLVSIGFTISFSALYSKTMRVNKLFRHARGFRRVTMKASDVMIPFFALFISNVLILSLWTIHAPLEWVRKPLSQDLFGRTVQSVGECHNERWEPYGTTLLLLNAIALILAIVEAFRARHITTEFSESKHIAMVMICILQGLFVGVPLYFFSRDWPSAELFVAAALIFIICMAMLLLIFVPKILAMKRGVQGTRRANENRNTRDSMVILHPSMSRSRSSRTLLQMRQDTNAFIADASASIAGLEEKVWTSAHFEKLQRLKEGFQRVSREVEELQADIAALTWARGEFATSRGSESTEETSPV